MDSGSGENVVDSVPSLQSGVEQAEDGSTLWYILIALAALIVLGLVVALFLIIQRGKRKKRDAEIAEQNRNIIKEAEAGAQPVSSPYQSIPRGGSSSLGGSSASHEYNGVAMALGDAGGNSVRSAISVASNPDSEYGDLRLGPQNTYTTSSVADSEYSALQL